VRGICFASGVKDGDPRGRVSSWHWRSAIVAVLLSIAGAVALTPAIADASELTSFAYVTGQGVSVINTKTNTVVAQVNTGSETHAVAITPNGRFAYVGDGPYEGVSVIETATNAIVANVPVPESRGPWGVAITPNGEFAYITNYNNAITVISTSTNTVVASIPANDGFPVGVAITPNGRFAYVAGYSGVDVIETATNTVVDTVGGIEGWEVAITPNGAFAYVTGDSGVHVIETATNKVIDTIPIAGTTRGVAITPDGRFVYVPNQGYDYVAVIETATNAVVDTVPVETSPFGDAITPDGAHVYVPNLDTGTVSVLGTSTNTVSTTVPLGSFEDAEEVAITPPIVGPETPIPPPPCSAPNTNGCLPLPCSAPNTNGCVPPVCSAPNTNGCLPTPCNAPNTNGCVPPPRPRPISATAAFSLPSAKQCVSHRRFTIHVRTLPGITWVSAVIKINGKRVKTLGRAHITALVNLVGLPKGTFVLSITAKASNGQTVTGTRTYHTCVPKGKNSYPAPRL
jgi:YVTN family beta-propeller protein